MSERNFNSKETWKRNILHIYIYKHIGNLCTTFYDLTAYIYVLRNNIETYKSELLLIPLNKRSCTILANYVKNCKNSKNDRTF